MFGRPPEGGLLSFCGGVGWTAAKCSGVFQRWTEHERRLLAVRRLRWAAQHSAKMRYCCVGGVVDNLFKLACWEPLTCASAESPESRPSCSPKLALLLALISCAYGGCVCCDCLPHLRSVELRH